MSRKLFDFYLSGRLFYFHFFLKGLDLRKEFLVGLTECGVVGTKLFDSYLFNRFFDLYFFFTKEPSSSCKHHQGIWDKRESCLISGLSGTKYFTFYSLKMKACGVNPYAPSVNKGCLGSYQLQVF